MPPAVSIFHGDERSWSLPASPTQQGCVTRITFPGFSCAAAQSGFTKICWNSHWKPNTSRNFCKSGFCHAERLYPVTATSAAILQGSSNTATSISSQRMITVALCIPHLMTGCLQKVYSFLVFSFFFFGSRKHPSSEHKIIWCYNKPFCWLKSKMRHRGVVKIFESTKDSWLNHFPDFHMTHKFVT